MLKVLIADDEKSIREGLACLINWNDYGFTVVGAAGNGVEALSFIRTHRPDLLVTDIRMPDMNGLELIEQVRSFDSKIKIVILSGHDSFEYAKSAIKYNTEQYLLKPVEEEELIECLKKIKKEKEESIAIDKEYAPILLRAFLAGQHTSPKPDAGFSAGSYYYLLIKPHMDDTMLLTVQRGGDISSLNAAVDRLLANKEGIFVLTQPDGAGVVVSKSALVPLADSIYEFAEKLHSDLEKDNIKADILIGSCVESVAELHKSREGIEVCKEKKFYAKDDEYIFSYDESTLFSSAFSKINLSDELVKAAIYGGYEEIEYACRALCEAFAEEKVASAVVTLHIDNILVELIKEVEATGGEQIRLFAKRSALAKVKNITINTVRIFLESLCKEAADTITELRQKKSAGLVGEVLSYIRENYKDEVDLKGLAQKFFINPDYLGRQIKKHTGVSYKQFLNRVRIEKAKELLQRGDCKVYEIAFRVGFKDPNYFSVKFEALEGVTPTQYRNQSTKHPSEK